MRPYLSDENGSENFIRSIGHNNPFMATYVMAKTASILSIIIQLMLLAAFLNVNFFKFSVEVVLYLTGDSDHVTLLKEVFPMRLLCKWENFDINGNLISRYVFCALPINGVLKWLFLFMLCWHIAVLLLNFLYAIYNGTLFFVALLKGKKQNHIDMEYADEILLYFIEINVSDEMIIDLKNKLLCVAESEV